MSTLASFFCSALAGLALSGAPAAAQFTAKDAQKAFKATISVKLGEHSDFMKTTVADFDAALDSAELLDPIGLGAIDAAFSAAVAALTAVDDINALTLGTIEGDGNDILGDFAAANPGELLPAGFVNGDGKDLDKALAKLDKAAGKNVGKLAKRLAKFAKKMTSKERLTFGRMEVPAVAGVAPEPDALVTTNVAPLVVDLWIGSRPEGDPDGGILIVGGFADDMANGGTVDVSIDGPGVVANADDVVVDTLRWSTSFSGLLPGNYTITVVQGDAFSASSVAAVP